MNFLLGKANQLLKGRPPEAEGGQKCHQCRKELPPTLNWGDISEETLDRLVDKVEVKEFQKGVYYQLKGSTKYLCSDCFWRPAKDEARKRDSTKTKTYKILNREITVTKKKKVQDPDVTMEKHKRKHQKETKKMLETTRKEREEERRKTEGDHDRTTSSKSFFGGRITFKTKEKANQADKKISSSSTSSKSKI